MEAIGMRTEVAAQICEGMRRAGVNFVASLPENNLEPLVTLFRDGAHGIHVPLAREEEGIGVCTGAYLGGKVPAMIMMDAGLLACSNALTVLAGQAGIPMLLLVGYSGGLGEPYFMHTPLGRVLEPLLGALGIVYTLADRADDLADKIVRANTLAHSSKRPVAVLLDGDCLRQ
jgi:sulfopyruvate decarboxylase subunit alpha